MLEPEFNLNLNAKSPDKDGGGGLDFIDWPHSLTQTFIENSQTWEKALRAKNTSLKQKLFSVD